MLFGRSVSWLRQPKLQSTSVLTFGTSKLQLPSLGLNIISSIILDPHRAGETGRAEKRKRSKHEGSKDLQVGTMSGASHDPIHWQQCSRVKLFHFGVIRANGRVLNCVNGHSFLFSPKLIVRFYRLNRPAIIVTSGHSGAADVTISDSCFVSEATC